MSQSCWCVQVIKTRVEERRQQEREGLNWTDCLVWFIGSMMESGGGILVWLVGLVK